MKGSVYMNKSENNDCKLLRFIYKNAEMGKVSLTQLQSVTNNDKFNETVKNLTNDYREVCNEAQQLMTDIGEDASGLSSAQKLMTDMAVKLNTLIDKSVSHIADMIIKGASMGISDISEAESECENANGKVKALSKRLRQINSDVIDKMKPFLSVTADN